MDIQPEINKAITNLSKIKTDRETKNGLSRGTVGWDQLSQAAEGQVDGLLKNDANVRAIAADRFQIDYDKFEELEAGGQNMRGYIKQQLLNEIQQGVAPYQGAQQIVGRGEAGVKQSSSASERQKFQQAQTMNNLYSSPEFQKAFSAEGGLTPEYVQQLTGSPTVEQSKKNPNVILFKDPRTGKVVAMDKTNPQVAIQNLAAARGVDTGLLSLGQQQPQGESPVQRKSPFRRLANWASSPFKRGTEGKDKPKADDIVNLSDELEQQHRDQGGYVTESGGLVQSGAQKGLSGALIGGRAGVTAGTAIGSYFGATDKLEKGARFGQKALQTAITGASGGAIGGAFGAAVGYGLESIGKAGSYIGDKAGEAYDAVKNYESPAEKLRQANVRKAQAKKIETQKVNRAFAEQAKNNKLKAQQAKIKKQQALKAKKAKEAEAKKQSYGGSYLGTQREQYNRVVKRYGKAYADKHYNKPHKYK